MISKALILLLILLSLSIVITIIQLMVLWYLKAKVVDYNKFVHDLYTVRGEKTPDIIGRVQYHYIEQYNDNLKKRVILKRIIKPMPLQGVNGKNICSLIDLQ